MALRECGTEKEVAPLSGQKGGRTLVSGWLCSLGACLVLFGWRLVDFWLVSIPQPSDMKELAGIRSAVQLGRWLSAQSEARGRCGHGPVLGFPKKGNHQLDGFFGVIPFLSPC